MDYILGTSQESYGDLGSLGIKIMLAPNRALTDADKRVLNKAMGEIYAGVMAETIRLNPKTAEERAAERTQMLALFDAPIFVEEIPNGYCNEWCCRQKPWFVVTTHRGRITIGWRKRAIPINLDHPLITESAENLFPTENVTKFGKSIHAWGYDAARKYLKVLLEG